MGRLEGKVAIVSGCASGIGESCARLMAAEGAQVVLADINITGVRAVADDISARGQSAFAHAVDLADEASIAALYAAVADRYGQLDVLHNNAAETSMEIMGADMAVADMEAAVWDRAFAINARGTMLMIKHALKPMVASGGGSVVNTSSGASLAGDFINPAYASSKAAINCLTLYVATQYGKHRIRCNVVSPGMIVTPKSQSILTDEQFAAIEKHKLTPYLGAPSDIAGAVLWLASDESRFVTAQIIAVDGGITAHMPHVADMRAEFDADPTHRTMRE